MKGALHIKTSKRRIHDLDAGDRLCILPEWSHHVRPPQSVSPAGLGCSQEQCYQFVAVVARPQLCTLVTCGSKGTGVIREGMCKHLILLFTGRNDAGGQENIAGHIKETITVCGLRSYKISDSAALTVVVSAFRSRRYRTSE
jgi:hypothetical protein